METFDLTCWKRREIEVIYHQTDPLFLIWVRITLRHSVSCSVVASSLRPMDSSLPDSSVYGILQATIPEWVYIPFSRESSQARDWTQVSCIAGRFFTIWATDGAIAIDTVVCVLIFCSENLNCWISNLPVPAL